MYSLSAALSNFVPQTLVSNVDGDQLIGFRLPARNSDTVQAVTTWSSSMTLQLVRNLGSRHKRRKSWKKSDVTIAARAASMRAQAAVVRDSLSGAPQTIVQAQDDSF
jgi:hypothetical protein